MLTGKAIARSLRAHFLLETALTTEIMKVFFPKSHSTEEEKQKSNDAEEDDDDYDDEDDYHDADNHSPNEVIYDVSSNEGIQSDINVVDDKIQDGERFSEERCCAIVQLCKLIEDDFEKGVEAIEKSELFQELIIKFADRKKMLQQSSRTAKFWLQYIQYVEILKDFIRSERTGNFSFHLITVRKMLNLFAATGHINYAKCGRLYLQQMLELETKYPWVHEKFAKDGYHTVRRTDRYWNGLWTDLIIEQVLMRSLKSRGGLTRGRGVTESTRTMWVGTMHRCAQVHNAMCNLTGLQHRSSEQHVELTTSRRRRDKKDLDLFKNWIQNHNPFDESNPSLRSLTSGLTAKIDPTIKYTPFRIPEGSQ